MIIICINLYYPIINHPIIYPDIACRGFTIIYGESFSMECRLVVCIMCTCSNSLSAAKKSQYHVSLVVEMAAVVASVIGYCHLS